MNRQIMKALLATFFWSFACALFASEADYLAFPIENIREPYASDHPDIGKPRAAEFFEAWIMLKKTSDSDEIVEAASEIVKADKAKLETLITNPKDAARALKYIKASKLDENALDNAVCAKAGDIYLLAYKMPQDSKLKKGMNIMAFEKAGDSFRWNPTFNDPLLPLVATSNLEDAKSGNNIPSYILSNSDEKLCRKLDRNDLPILCFQNGVLVSMEEIERVYTTSEAKFYHKAQEIFYSWKLKEYSEYMTKSSKERFMKQYGDMPEDERKKVLGEYFQWSKIYHKVMKAGKESMILFSRHKEGATAYNDTAYLFALPDDNWAITKFSAEKSALDLFLGRYILPNKDYFLLIAPKFIKHPIDER